MSVCDLWKHFHLDKKRLLFECEDFCFEKFWYSSCESHGRGMVWYSSYIQTIKKWENIHATKNIDFHNYIINIHSFDPKPIRDWQFHIECLSNLKSQRLMYMLTKVKNLKDLLYGTLHVWKTGLFFKKQNFKMKQKIKKNFWPLEVILQAGQ